MIKSLTMNTRAATLAVLLGLAAGAAGCEDDEDVFPPPSPARSDAGDAGGPMATVPDAQRADLGSVDAGVIDAVVGSDAPVAPPLYAIMYEVFSEMGSNSYLSLLDSLDIKQVDITKAREYAGGRAFLASYNGWIFVGDPTAPIVTRYSVTAEGTMKEEGKLSFANFGLDAGNLDPWNVTFINANKAYLFDYKEGTQIIWNPTKMEITGEIKAPAELLRPNLSLDGSPASVRGNRLYRSFSWVDFETATYSTDQLLGIYDVENDKLLELVKETRCPSMGNLTHQDEQGNIYMSNWIWPISGTLMKGAPKSCVLRIAAGANRFDASWSLNYGELAGGREGAMFSYLGAGKGLVSIFHHELTTFDAMTDPWDYAGRPIWRIWSVDLAARTAAPLEGIEPNAGAYTPVNVDGRSLLMVPGKDWASTQLYEIKDGRAVPKFDVRGWTYQFVKVR